jgi:outer membrane murein-binding lipoprotein Lpp
MMDKEDLILEELRKLNAKVDTMQQDVSQLKEDVAQLKEDSEITRTGVNALIEWAEDVSNAIRFPLPKLK